MKSLLILFLFFPLVTTQVIEEHKPIEIIAVNSTTTFTAFTLSSDETDGNPCLAAGKNNLCELKPILKERGISICASRDFPLNSEMYISEIGICRVLDRMNIRYKGTNRIDVLMDSKKEALIFGKRELSYVIIK